MSATLLVERFGDSQLFAVPMTMAMLSVPMHQRLAVVDLASVHSATVGGLDIAPMSDGVASLCQTPGNAFPLPPEIGVTVVMAG